MHRFTDWRQWHWQEYTAELLGTAFNVFVGLSAVVFNMSKGSPMEHLIPNHSLRLLLTGLLFAGSGSLFAISPLGKLSGAHINPSVSLAFWAQGKMHHDSPRSRILPLVCLSSGGFNHLSTSAVHFHLCQ